jgi:hypothetical protein
MFSWLNVNTLQGILRAGLAFGGGILVGKGMLTAEQLNTLTQQLTSPEFLGSAVAVITAVWSIIHKTPITTVASSTTTATTVAK